MERVVEIEKGLQAEEHLRDRIIRFGTLLANIVYDEYIYLKKLRLRYGIYNFQNSGGSPQISFKVRCTKLAKLKQEESLDVAVVIRRLPHKDFTTIFNNFNKAQLSRLSVGCHKLINALSLHFVLNSMARNLPRVSQIISLVGFRITEKQLKRVLTSLLEVENLRFRECLLPLIQTPLKIKRQVLVRDFNIAKCQDHNRLPLGPSNPTVESLVMLISNECFREGLKLFRLMTDKSSSGAEYYYSLAQKYDIGSTKLKVSFF
ncbi:unnamed protein product [Moneuplotes crassus]|uniref:Uncharacterized protein n=1 Tax=Euplotes crassus TaxID=5936 RepID=A0AAD1XTI3_EUPCR|nr:unnamed protein product [Moneuplotes crassus]